MHPSDTPDTSSAQDAAEEPARTDAYPAIDVWVDGAGDVILQQEDRYGDGDVILVKAAEIETLIEKLSACIGYVPTPPDYGMQDERPDAGTLEPPAKDRTNAERQRRYRERQRNARNGDTVTQDPNAVTEERNGDPSKTALEGNAQPRDG